MLCRFLRSDFAENNGSGEGSTACDGKKTDREGLSGDLNNGVVGDNNDSPTGSCEGADANTRECYGGNLDGDSEEW